MSTFVSRYIAILIRYHRKGRRTELAPETCQTLLPSSPTTLSWVALSAPFWATWYICILIVHLARVSPHAPDHPTVSLKYYWWVWCCIISANGPVITMTIVIVTMIMMIIIRDHHYHHHHSVGVSPKTVPAALDRRTDVRRSPPIGNSISRLHLPAACLHLLPCISPQNVNTWFQKHITIMLLNTNNLQAEYPGKRTPRTYSWNIDVSTTHLSSSVSNM